MSKRTLFISVATITLITSLLYLASDLIEVYAGGFQRYQLYMTYAAMVLVPAHSYGNLGRFNTTRFAGWG